MKVFISHLHGDHVLGLPGLLQTMALMDRKEPLQIYGPPGIRAYLMCAKETLNFSLTYPVTIVEMDGDSFVFDEEEYKIAAENNCHSVKGFCFAFIEKPRAGRFYPEKAVALGVPEGKLWSKLQDGEEVTSTDGRIVKPSDVMGPLRPGRKVIYTGDTKPFKAFKYFAENADLIIHDCTFDDSLVERAVNDGHSTPSQAAEQAQAAGATRLVLTHISARYSDATLLLEQAKQVFPNTVLADDYLEIELPLNE